MTFVIRFFDVRLLSLCVYLVKSTHSSNHFRHSSPSSKKRKTLDSSDKQKIRNRHRVQMIFVVSHKLYYILIISEVKFKRNEIYYRFSENL